MKVEQRIRDMRRGHGHGHGVGPKHVDESNEEEALGRPICTLRMMFLTLKMFS
jgi:hypothetical protein